MQPAAGPQYRTAVIERGDMVATVSASGQVMPVTQVTVGSQVSGQIRELYVDFNSEVKAGQLIAQIDPQLIEFQVRQAQADLEAARSQVLIAQANVLVGQTGVSRAQVDVAQAERDWGRQSDLVGRGFIAQSEADKAKSALDNARQALQSAKAQSQVTAAQVQAAQATVQQRAAALAQAQTNLSRTRITSPVDGIVIKRAVERGQTVAASLQAPELFVIAQNLRDMRVEVSVDESDVGRIKAGQKATFTVDAFAGQTFEGVIDQVRQSPVTANNVVTYIAAVHFANTSGRLLPGMTANVRIVTDQRDGVLKVPNAALRVRMPDAQVAKAPAEQGSKAKAPGAESAPSAGAPASSPALSGPMAAMRERLVETLSPTPDQLQRIDAVLAGSRPAFASVRDLPEEQRSKARQRAMADVRAQIHVVLTPSQQIAYAQMQANAAGTQSDGSRGTRGRVWVLDAVGKPQAVEVRLGLTDGNSTELLLPRSAAASPSADSNQASAQAAAQGKPMAANVAQAAAVLREGVAVVTGTVSADAAGAARSSPGSSARGPAPGRLPF